MDTLWMRKYLRIPFMEKGRDFNGCDCWGLMYLIYKTELGIVLPDYLDEYTSTGRRHAHHLDSIFRREMSTKVWNEVRPEDAKPFDGVCIRIANDRVHVGVVVSEGRMIHIQERGCPVIASYVGAEWKNRVVGIYRHESFI